MKFKNYVSEERLSSQDKRNLLKAISNPKRDAMINAGGSTINVVAGNKGNVSFVYDSGNHVLTKTLVDISDRGGMKFDSNLDKNVHKMTFTIFKDS
jgi:hypothetical protein